jgi:hypothetical protein
MLICFLAIEYTWTSERILLCYLLNLLVGFKGSMLCIDVRITWNQLYLLHGLSVHQFLETLPFCNYVKLQPPLFTWLVAQTPSYFLQQIYALFWTGVCLKLCIVLYGRTQMLLIAATPLMQIMSLQPMNDLYAFGLVLIALRFIQMHHRWFAGVTILLACFLKYSTIIVVPFLIPMLWPSFSITLPIIGGGIYGWWASKWYWGHLHARFLLHQFSGGLYSMYRRPSNTLPRKNVLKKLMLKLFHSLKWRWVHLSCASLKAIPFYLFPLWCISWHPYAYFILAGILVGYGNIKYLLLVIPFMFQITTS